MYRAVLLQMSCNENNVLAGDGLQGEAGGSPSGHGQKKVMVIDAVRCSVCDDLLPRTTSRMLMVVEGGFIPERLRSRCCFWDTPLLT